MLSNEVESVLGRMQMGPKSQDGGLTLNAFYVHKPQMLYAYFHMSFIGQRFIR